MRRLILAICTVFVLGVCAVRAQVLINYFASHHDHVLPESPCPTFEAPQPVSHDGTLMLLYCCMDGRMIARTFSTEPPDTIPPPPGMVTCPGGHRACSCLPAGNYYATWIETVGCAR